MQNFSTHCSGEFLRLYFLLGFKKMNMIDCTTKEMGLLINKVGVHSIPNTKKVSYPSYHQSMYISFEFTKFNKTLKRK